MRKVRKRIKHAKVKMAAVDVCFVALAISTSLLSHKDAAREAEPFCKPVEAADVSYSSDSVEMLEDYEPNGPTGGDESTEVFLEVEEKETEAGYCLSSDEEYVLKKITMAEAECEPLDGKALVMRVVLNRMQDDEFPEDVQGVVFQPGQFTPVDNGRYYDVEPDEDCQEAYEMVMNGWDESEGALYFASTDFPHSWHENNLDYLYTVGTHDFYK